VLGKDYDTQACSVARTLEVVGERWTLLVVRDALQGKKRFEEFQASLGIARNVLAKRLDTLVEHGVMERVPYSERPLRHEYRLTEAGRELRVALIALLRWGERHIDDPEVPHVKVRHRDCGGDVVAQLLCTECGASPTPSEVESVRLTPGRVRA
jgi:DNA-binding HxlR family transcriptional regulator